MAGLAGPVSGISNRPGFDFIDGIATEMTVLPKAARHQRVAQQHKDNQARNEQKSHSKQMFRILEFHAHCPDPCRSSREADISVGPSFPQPGFSAICAAIPANKSDFHPLSFMAFLMLGGLLLAAGIITYILDMVFPSHTYEEQAGSK
jgi:hypothetical protein